MIQHLLQIQIIVVYIFNRFRCCASCSGETDGSGHIVDNDLDNDGVCDSDEIVGCQDLNACNYMILATDADNCIYSTDLDACASCSGETDGSGHIVDNDLDNDIHPDDCGMSMRMLLTICL